MANIREQQERTDAELEQLEPKTEQIERQIEEIEHAIQEIEATLSRLESGGDQDVADAVRKTLAERMQEKQQVEQEAQQVAQQLQKVFSEIREVDQWNDEARREIANLESLGENVGDAANRIADRDRWTEETYEKAREMQQRLGKATGGFG